MNLSSDIAKIVGEHAEYMVGKNTVDQPTALNEMWDYMDSGFEPQIMDDKEMRDDGTKIEVRHAGNTVFIGNTDIIKRKRYLTGKEYPPHSPTRVLNEHGYVSQQSDTPHEVNRIAATIGGYTWAIFKKEGGIGYIGFFHGRDVLITGALSAIDEVGQYLVKQLE